MRGLDLSLVDPDNRRPVDYGARARRLLTGDGPSGAKAALVQRMLRWRAQAPALYAKGDYHPLAASGSKCGHILAFERRDGPARLLCAVMIRAGEAILARGGMPGQEWWGDTRLDAYPGIDPATVFAATPFHIDLDEGR